MEWSGRRDGRVCRRLQGKKQSERRQGQGKGSCSCSCSCCESSGRKQQLRTTEQAEVSSTRTHNACSRP